MRAIRSHCQLAFRDALRVADVAPSPDHASETPAPGAQQGDRRRDPRGDCSGSGQAGLRWPHHERGRGGGRACRSARSISTSRTRRRWSRALIERHIEEMNARGRSTELARVAHAADRAGGARGDRADDPRARVDPELHRVLTEQVPRVGRMARIARARQAISHRMVAALLAARRDELAIAIRIVAAFVLVSAIEAIVHRAALFAPDAPARSAARRRGDARWSRAISASPRTDDGRLITRRGRPKGRAPLVIGPGWARIAG